MTNRIYTDQLRLFALSFETYEAFDNGLQASDEYPMSIFKGYAERMKKSFFHISKRFPGWDFPHSRWKVAHPEITKLSELIDDMLAKPWDIDENREGYYFFHENDAIEKPKHHHLYVKLKKPWDEGTFYENYLESMAIGFNHQEEYYAILGVKNQVKWPIAIVQLDVNPWIYEKTLEKNSPPTKS